MASITFSEKAPTDQGPVTFTFGAEQFDLAPGDKYETSDHELIAAAIGNRWLKVEYDLEKETAKIAYDPNDPHDNPAADHLSPHADAEVKAAADYAEAATLAEAYPDDPRYPVPDAPAADAPASSEPATTPAYPTAGSPAGTGTTPPTTAKADTTVTAPVPENAPTNTGASA